MYKLRFDNSLNKRIWWWWAISIFFFSAEHLRCNVLFTFVWHLRPNYCKNAAGKPSRQFMPYEKYMYFDVDWDSSLWLWNWPASGQIAVLECWSLDINDPGGPDRYLKNELHRRIQFTRRQQYNVVVLETANQATSQHSVGLINDLKTIWNSVDILQQSFHDQISGGERSRTMDLNTS